MIVCLLVVSHDINTLYLLLFAAGATFGGRVIVSIIWVVEY
jgi:hypothetical protein